MDTSVHRWRFVRVGGVDQMVFRNAADITHLDELDQKLWVALACPTRGLELDSKLLDAIDTDHDGRIRVPEVLDAIHWLKDVHASPDEILKGGDALPISTIRTDTPAGTVLLSGVRRILSDLGKADADRISLTDIADAEKIAGTMRFNGDGVVPAESAADETTRLAIADIIATCGSVADRSGKPGVNWGLLDAFFKDAATFIEWNAKGEADSATRPLGDDTAAAAAVVSTLKGKVDDYFTRCRLAAFEPHAARTLNGAEEDFAALAHKDLATSTRELVWLPLARVEAGHPLPIEEEALTDGINPAWADAVSELARVAVRPLLGAGRTSLTAADWTLLQSKLAAYQSWLATKPEVKVEALGLPRLRALLSSNVREEIAALISQDAALEQEVAQFVSVQKLLLCQRDFFKLLNNFVNFSEFYSRHGAVFQAGTLYFDGRSCALCVRVDDVGKHAALAGLAKTYLAYCDCTRPGGEKMTIAAAITGGDSDYVMIGRNGIFYDRLGRDWDAIVTKIIENPISIRQAFWAPYKSFIRMIEAQVARRAAAADNASSEKLKTAAESTANIDKTKPPEAKPADKKIDIGTVAAIGVAVGGIATFLSILLASL